jgi:hypothetical protein
MYMHNIFGNAYSIINGDALNVVTLFAYGDHGV